MSFKYPIAITNINPIFDCSSVHQQLGSRRGSTVKVALQRMRREMRNKTSKKIHHHHSPSPDHKHLTPNDAEPSSWFCLRRRKKNRNKDLKYEVDVYHPIQTISRSADGKFVLDDRQDLLQKNQNDNNNIPMDYYPGTYQGMYQGSYPGHPVVLTPNTDLANSSNDNLNNKHNGPSQKTYLSQPNRYHHKDFNVPQDYLSRRNNLNNKSQTNNRDTYNKPRNSLKSDYLTKGPQIRKNYLTGAAVDNNSEQKPLNNVKTPQYGAIRSPQNNHMRSPAESYRTPLGAGWFDDPYFQQNKSPYKFGAWRDNLPTSSTATANTATPQALRDPIRDRLRDVISKPTGTPSNQTYLTSSPDHNASNGTPFVISDVSSVNPSFSTNGERSHNEHGNMVISDSSIGRPDWTREELAAHPDVNEQHEWNYPLPGDYYKQVRNLAGQYGHPLDSPGSVALYQIPESQSSSPHELTYTRDHLDRAIQKVRAGHTPQDSVDSTEHPNHKQGGRQPANFRTSVAPYKNYPLTGSTSSSGVGSATAAGGNGHNGAPRMPVYQRHLSSPNSSGIGSRENSHSTGSVSHPNENQLDNGLNILTPNGLNAIAGVDDHLNEWYRNNTQTPPGRYYQVRQPKIHRNYQPHHHNAQPRKESKDYAASQERFQRLREEYLAYQLSQHSGDKFKGTGQVSSYVQEIESEML